MCGMRVGGGGLHTCNEAGDGKYSADGELGGHGSQWV